MRGTGAGRPPKSRGELERAGTFRKDRHGDLKNPTPTEGSPEPPGELEGIAADEWARMVWAFTDMGMLHKVDAFAIHQYCRLYAETEAVAVQQAECAASVKLLEENLHDTKGPDLVQLFAEIVTLRKLIAKATDQLRQGRIACKQFLVEFGLTPASRGRIKLPSKGEQVDEFTRYQQGRGVA